MKKIILPAMIMISSVMVYAQDQTVKDLQTESQKQINKDPADTANKVWKTGGILSLSIAQGSTSNWAAGGDKFSLSLNSYINAHAFYKKGKNSWDNNLDFNLGYMNTSTLGNRKNDDRIDITSKYGYALNPKLNIAALGDIRSQFFKGYTYPDNITKVYSSNFFSPAYVLLSLGLDYHPISNLSIFVSPVTNRWTFVNDTALSTLYGLDPGKKSLYQIGAYASINYTTNLGKVVTYTGRLDLFSNYKHNPQNVDLYMTNLFAVKLSKVLSATWSLDMIYDDDVRIFGANQNAPALQLKSLVGVGLLVKL
ncbi:MAG: DUF3078 domain-containing protein [Bacteroidetes bacterium]|nr:DUF3078 domain-containing protein [Bacteroidota bacterium]